MKVLKIAKADDSRTYYSTNISFSGLPENKYGRYYRNYKHF